MRRAKILGIAILAFWAGLHTPSPTFAAKSNAGPSDLDHIIPAIHEAMKLRIMTWSNKETSNWGIVEFQPPEMNEHCHNYIRRTFANNRTYIIKGAACRHGNRVAISGETHFQTLSQSGDPTIAKVQILLSALLYEPGEIDGVYGRQTRQAIKSYELDHGLPLRGVASDQIAEHMFRVAQTEIRRVELINLRAVATIDIPAKERRFLPQFIIREFNSYKNVERSAKTHGSETTN